MSVCAFCVSGKGAGGGGVGSLCYSKGGVLR